MKILGSTKFGGILGALRPERRSEAGASDRFGAFVGLKTGLPADKDVAEFNAIVSGSFKASIPFPTAVRDPKTRLQNLIEAKKGHELSDFLERLGSEGLVSYVDFITRVEDRPSPKDHVARVRAQATAYRDLTGFLAHLAQNLPPGSAGGDVFKNLPPKTQMKVQHAVSGLVGEQVGKLVQALGEQNFVDVTKCESLAKGNVPTRNDTDLFLDNYAAALNKELEFKIPEHVQVWICPGFNGENLNDLGYQDITRTTLLKTAEDKAQVQEIKYATTDTSAVVAESLIEKLKAVPSGQKVLFVGHSMAGAHWAALQQKLNELPEGELLREKLIRPVLQQPAFFSWVAKLADVLEENTDVKKFVGEILHLFLDAPKDRPFAALKTMAQSPSSQTEQKGGRDLSPHILASSHNGSGIGILCSTIKVLEKMGIASDGLVAELDQIAFKNSRVVVLPLLLDHAEPGLSPKSFVRFLAQVVRTGGRLPSIDGVFDRLADERKVFGGWMRSWYRKATENSCSGDERERFAQKIETWGLRGAGLIDRTNNKREPGRVDAGAMTLAMCKLALDSAQDDGLLESSPPVKA